MNESEIKPKEINVLETSDQAKRYIEKKISNLFKSNLKPPPKLNLVQWADTYRVLAAESSSEAGQWRTDRVIAAKQPMLSITNPEVEQVSIMACTQFMKTEIILNATGFFAHQQPSPMIIMQPTTKMAEAFSKDRVAPMFRESPVLKDMFANNRRDSGNTILHKQFPSGQLTMVGSNSPADLASRPVAKIFCDEIDKYPMSAGDEGDPIKLLYERSATFPNRLLVVVCSPTIEGKSRIEREYNQSDMRVFHHQCPHCKDYTPLVWENVTIPKDKVTGRFLPDEAFIACPKCGAAWDEKDRHTSIRNHKWVATRPEVKRHHGYHVSKFASPWETVAALANKFVKALDDIESMKTFQNTQMARTWREKGEQPDWKRLYERRESYSPLKVPKGGLMLTCGIDIQKDYSVYEVVAWGRRKESWSIDKGIIEGGIETQEAKEKLSDFLDRTYKNESGLDMAIEKVCVDSGFNTSSVYEFVRWYGSERVVAIKGEDSLTTMIGTPRPVDVMLNGKRLSRGMMLWGIGSSVIKEQIYKWFNAEKPTDEEIEEGREMPTGYCHFPMWDEEFFKQITAEQYVMQTDNRGFTKYYWEKLRKDNHFLDARVYARAGAAMLQIDRMTESNWKEREEIFEPQTQAEKDQSVSIINPVIKTKEFERPKDRSKYIDPNGRKRKRGTWIKR